MIHDNYYRNGENFAKLMENKLNHMQFSEEEKKQYLNHNLIKIRQAHTIMLNNHKKSRSLMLSKTLKDKNIKAEPDDISRQKSVADDRLAGKDSEALTTELDRAMRVAREEARLYNEMNEDDRRIHYSNMIIKDHNYYNKKDSLWNEPHRLHPKKFAIYSEKGTIFKNANYITDLEAIKDNEKKEKFSEAFEKIVKLRE